MADKLTVVLAQRSPYSDDDDAVANSTEGEVVITFADPVRATAYAESLRQLPGYHNPSSVRVIPVAAADPVDPPDMRPLYQVTLSCKSEDLTSKPSRVSSLFDILSVGERPGDKVTLKSYHITRAYNPVTGQPNNDSAAVYENEEGDPVSPATYCRVTAYRFTAVAYAQSLRIAMCKASDLLDHAIEEAKKGVLAEPVKFDMVDHGRQRPLPKKPMKPTRIKTQPSLDELLEEESDDV